MQRALNAADLAAAATSTAMTMLRRGYVYRYSPYHENLDGYAASSDDKGKAEATTGIAANKEEKRDDGNWG